MEVLQKDYQAMGRVSLTALSDPRQVQVHVTKQMPTYIWQTRVGCAMPSSLQPGAYSLKALEPTPR